MLTSLMLSEFPAVETYFVRGRPPAAPLHRLERVFASDRADPASTRARRTLKRCCSSSVTSVPNASIQRPSGRRVNLVVMETFYGNR